ncbi:hypothetical protein B4U80_00871 [Leptotrombidium deliense]|uniref:Methionine adenosyltransferase 2 subunit beta n=1 Tax=Leptotrombidium deliense TaxID=299467 RepID=A0A443SLJ7_9ACAR|nr:hypothetical protein B4U80_00871 [Leptotrombidium deliense]
MNAAKRRVVITGASGLLGRTVIKEFNCNGWETLGFAFSRIKPGLINVDINDTSEVSKQLSAFKPDVLINCAAQRFPDKFDENVEQSYNLNVKAAETIAKLCHTSGIHFLQISTDYVFSGNKAPYSESDETDAINNYGKSKADAEKSIVNVTHGKACVLRVPVLYGDEEYVGESAVSALIKDLLNTNTEKLVSDYELRNPSCVDDIASICVQLMNAKINDPDNVSGIYQWCGNETLTKYAMIQTMAKVFNKNADHIKPDPNPSKGSPRPFNTQMLRSRLQSLGIEKHTEFAKAVEKYFKKFIV